MKDDLYAALWHWFVKTYKQNVEFALINVASGSRNEVMPRRNDVRTLFLGSHRQSYLYARVKHCLGQLIRQCKLRTVDTRPVFPDKWQQIAAPSQYWRHTNAVTVTFWPIIRQSRNFCVNISCDISLSIREKSAQLHPDFAQNSGPRLGSEISNL